MAFEAIPIRPELNDNNQRDALILEREASGPPPELIIHAGNLPATAEALRDLLAASGKFFDRGLPVRVITPADGGPPSAIPLTKSNVVMQTHRLCKPMKVRSDGAHVPQTLPDRLAQMYLEMSGEWGLPPLAGVSTAPLLSRDGSVRTADGYDRGTTLWCCNIPALKLPSRPSCADAEEALAHAPAAIPDFSLWQFAPAVGCLAWSRDHRHHPTTGTGRERFSARCTHGRLPPQPTACAGISHNGTGCVGSRQR